MEDRLVHLDERLVEAVEKPERFDESLVHLDPRLAGAARSLVKSGERLVHLAETLKTSNGGGFPGDTRTPRYDCINLDTTSTTLADKSKRMRIYPLTSGIRPV